MMTILLILTISFLFVCQNIIDPYFIQFMKNDSNDTLFQVSDEILIKRFRKSKIVLIPLIFWSFFDYSFLYLFVILGLFLFMLKKDELKAKNQITKEKNLLKFQFPIWLRQLQILLQTNTVSQSLQLSYEYAPNLIKKELKQFIQEIENDALNISPYLNFLKFYRLNEIERAMKLLYRYNTVGKDDAYIQFNRMIQTTTKWLRNERTEHHKNSLALYEWISMVPLVGVTVLFIAIMCEVIINMFSNGI